MHSTISVIADAGAPGPGRRSDHHERSDAELLALITTDDLDALAALWSRYRRLAYAIALRATNRFDADDVVAEAFTRIVGALRRGNGPREHFGAYVGITVRTVVARWGRGVEETTVADVAAFDGAQRGSDDLDPAVIVGVFTDPHLESAFRALPERWQQILWSNVVEDMSVAELSEMLGMTPAVVAAVAYRARKGLRREWDRARLAS